ncbi:hypothetical protein J2S13_001191 [Oikeobacillus pervagus]|uniref:DUF2777 domain-containing protein n=1 Tax=Oikeobacillus pervagus TaxID=1325931 RepID=A0AAJ1T2N1_9BACI|nr:DUF2777 family protein [Oikeobacillus pervagus]MDQ0214794.1 hypothetical protein [Oikeobacillus pervagus]
MRQWHREQLIERQARSFQEGVVEYINDQWVFFDDVNDEAINLEQFFHSEVEIYRFKQWKKGILQDDAMVSVESKLFPLNDMDHLRVKKNLVLSLEMLLEEISDDSFLQLLTTINGLHFSIYDCIYCHNHLSFLNKDRIRQGTNFIILDNGELICSVQHHFLYRDKRRDRFEVTLSTGKRVIIEKLE